MIKLIQSLYQKILSFFVKKGEETDEAIKEDTIIVDRKVYEKMTKNQLVEELWKMDIPHNKRQVKSELIDLLMK